MVGIAQGLEQSSGAQIRAADAQNHHSIHEGTEPGGRGDDSPQIASLPFAPVAVESLLRQIDETRVQRLQLRRNLLELPLSGYLAANLHQVGKKCPQSARLEEVLNSQLRHAGPLFLMGHQETLIIV